MSSSVRIRDNQRRSRARRKEYIQDLEKRLHKYQTEGIHATREVQEAGRKVAVENSLLRSLLILHGVSDQRVQEYLRAHRADTFLPIPRSDLVQEERSHLEQSPRLTIVDSGGPSPTSYKRNDSPPDRTATEPTSWTLSLSPVIHQQVDISDSQISDGDSELSVPFDSSTSNTSTLQPPNTHQDSRQSG